MRGKKKAHKKDKVEEKKKAVAEKEQQETQGAQEAQETQQQENQATQEAQKNQEGSGAPAEQGTEDTEQKELSLEEQIAALSDALAVSEDKNLRIQAEFQNYRKRTYKDINTARQMAIEDTVVPFLQVFDHFNMAVHAAKNSNNMEALLQGLEMILNEYSKALDELGITKFDADGEMFDPERHEAVANEASDEVEEGRVIKQWSCGYMLGEKLLRPARVVVSSGPAQDKSEAAENDDKGDADKATEE